VTIGVEPRIDVHFGEHLSPLSRFVPPPGMRWVSTGTAFKSPQRRLAVATHPHDAALSPRASHAQFFREGVEHDTTSLPDQGGRQQ
jgi:hypothetical protein